MNRLAVVEFFVRGKAASPDLCEDVIFRSDDFVAVIDGATSKDQRGVVGMTGGHAVALEVKTAIEALDRDVDARAGVEAIIAHVAAWRKAGGRRFRQIPTASLILYSHHRDEVWSLGDCGCVIDGVRHGGVKRVDLVAASYRRAVINAALLSGKTSVAEIQRDDIGRRSILKLLRSQAVFQNDKRAGDLAYGVIDGNPTALDFLEVFKARSARSVVLASDGYPKILPTLAQSENYLESVLKADPLLIGDCPSTKGVNEGDLSFDDRAYVRLSA